MDQDRSRPTAKELTELTAFLSAREQQVQPLPGEPGFPTGLAGELLILAESTQPDPAFATRLELQLRQAVKAGSKGSRPGWWHALWQSFSIPERKTAMKRLIAFALIGIVLFALIFISIPSLFPSPTQTQLVLATPPTSTRRINLRLPTYPHRGSTHLSVSGGDQLHTPTYPKPTSHFAFPG